MESEDKFQEWSKELFCKEELRPVKGFEELYLVSNFGRVWSLISKRFLAPRPLPVGYLRVQIKGKDYYIHRLVAEAFLPNKDNLPMVNHKDFNKSNNNLNNLEWCTASHNIRHAVGSDATVKGQKERVKKISIPVVQLSIEGEFIQEFPSLRVAGTTLGFDNTNIAHACREDRLAYGFRWKFKEEM